MTDNEMAPINEHNEWLRLMGGEDRVEATGRSLVYRGVTVSAWREVSPPWCETAPGPATGWSAVVGKRLISVCTDNEERLEDLLTQVDESLNLIRPTPDHEETR